MNHLNNSIRHTNIFKLYDIQNDFKRHKDKVNKIRNKNAKQSVHRQYNSQMNIANELKRKWITAEVSKNHKKQKQIFEQNQILYHQIIKAKTRPFERKKIISEINQSSRLMRTSHSLNRENSYRKIIKDNQKLMEKILLTKSPLSRDNLNKEYKKVRETKKRLQTHSNVNKSRMKLTFKKINIKPSIYLPDLTDNSNHRKVYQSSLTTKNKIQHPEDSLQMDKDRLYKKNKQQNKSFTVEKQY